MRRLLKFLHTLGAIGLMGAIACLLVLLAMTPAPAALAEYARMRGAMGAIASWILLPSLALTLIAGLLSMAANRSFQNAGWAWVKVLTGVIVFEWGFAGIQGPMQAEAELSARALAGEADVAGLAASVSAEQGSLWVLLAVATLNVALGVWRPKLTRLPD